MDTVALRAGVTIDGDVKTFSDEPVALLRGVDDAGHPLTPKLTRDDLVRCIAVADI